MIEWGPFSRTLGYKNEIEMWKDLYEVKQLSISQISRKLDVSRNVVRVALAEAGIAARKRGGPNNSRVVLTQEILDEIRRDGLAAVAKRLDLDYSTLYKRLRHAKIRIADLRAQSVVEVDGVPETAGTDQADVSPERKDDETRAK